MEEKIPLPKRDGNNMQKDDLEIISGIINENKFEDILEIGTYNGYSAIFLINNCKTIKNFVTVDYIPKDRKRTTLKGSGFSPEEIENFSNKLSELKKKYNIKKLEIRTEGSNNFFKDNKKTFDVIIIDGDHSYEQSKRDLENALKVIRKRGVIIMHDIRDSSYVQNLPPEENCTRTFKECKLKKELKKTSLGLGIIWPKSQN